MKTKSRRYGSPGPETPITLRGARREDGAEIWRLARDVEGVEPNSCYAYLLLATHFRDTAVVAESEKRLVGYVVGYRLPERAEAVFVWQVAVAPECRGMGVGKRLLLAFLDAPGCTSARFLEATVGGSNAPSRHLFESVARARGTSFRWEPGFTECDFTYTEHEPEERIVIGPLDRRPETP